MNLRTVYLVLAVAGAIIPWAFFLQHFESTGVGAMAFLRAVFANPAASGFTADVVLSSVVFWILVLRQRLERHGPPPLPFILLNLLFGLSCALPAWLYACARRPATADPA